MVVVSSCTSGRAGEHGRKKVSQAHVGPARLNFWALFKAARLSGIGDPGAGRSWEHQGVSEFFSLSWCVLTSSAFYVHIPGNSS